MNKHNYRQHDSPQMLESPTNISPIAQPPQTLEFQQPKVSRWTGIDLFRVIAVFGVIILHADEGLSQLPPSWPSVLNFFSFAVPFFLATSFWLSAKKLTQSGNRFRLSSRFTRLLIPYLSWTIVYLGYKVFKYSLVGELANVKQIFQNTLGVILTGDAAFHLYFLPLLLAGTLIIYPLADSWSKESKTWQLSYLIGWQILSLLGYQIYRDFTTNILVFADSIWLKEVATFVGYFVRCLPYIVSAMILNHSQVANYWRRPNAIKILTVATIFLLANLVDYGIVPHSLHELIRGVSALLLAILISGYLEGNRWLVSLSKCSFGIFLVHLLFVEVFQIAENRLLANSFRVSTPNLLAFSVLVFLLSWLVVDRMLRHRLLAKLLFGVGR